MENRGIDKEIEIKLIKDKFPKIFVRILEDRKAQGMGRKREGSLGTLTQGRRDRGSHSIAQGVEQRRDNAEKGEKRTRIDGHIEEEGGIRNG